jgi:hypothetical protein
VQVSAVRTMLAWPSWSWTLLRSTPAVWARLAGPWRVEADRGKSGGVDQVSEPVGQPVARVVGLAVAYGEDVSVLAPAVSVCGVPELLTVAVGTRAGHGALVQASGAPVLLSLAMQLFTVMCRRPRRPDTRRQLGARRALSLALCRRHA